MNKQNNLLLEILAKKNMGYNELAEIAGISSGAISEIINGKSNPRNLTKIKIANALEVKVEEIFPSKDSTSNNVSSNDLYTKSKDFKELKSKVEDLEKKLSSIENFLKGLFPKSK